MSCATQRLDSLQEDSAQLGSSAELLPRGDSRARGQDGARVLECTTDQNVILLGMVADASDDRTLYGSWARTRSTSTQQIQHRINRLFFEQGVLARR